MHFVYRTGEYSLLDWSAELRHLLSQQALASEAIPQLNFGMQLKRKFLRSLLFRRQVFSLPCTGYAEAAAALDGKLIAAADEALRTAADSIQFMQVVEVRTAPAEDASDRHGSFLPWHEVARHAPGVPSSCI